METGIGLLSAGSLEHVVITIAFVNIGNAGTTWLSPDFGETCLVHEAATVNQKRLAGDKIALI